MVATFPPDPPESPPESPVVLIPGISAWMPPAVRDVGIAARTSLLTVCCTFALCTSTIGVSPVTVIVSSNAPTFSSPLTVATNVPDNSMPSRLTVLKPGSENVTEYVPGRRSTIRYCPVASLMTDRTFSIRAGLAASTVTPGSTPPDASLTTPVIAACAEAVDGRSRRTSKPNKPDKPRRTPGDRCRDLNIAYPPQQLRVDDLAVDCVTFCAEFVAIAKVG